MCANRMSRVVAGLMVLLLAAACSPGGRPSPPTPTPMPLSQIAIAGQPFSLDKGGTAILGETGAELTFIGVTEDSRCPIEADCVWAGLVIVEIAIRQAGSSQTFEMMLKPGAEAPQVEVEGAVLQLEAVDPEPSLHNPTDVPYVATFVIVSSER